MRIELVHEDDRRVISEVNSPEFGFSIQKFFVKTSIPLGNHYHRRKTEIFVIDCGGGTLITDDRHGTRTESLVGEGDVIYIPPELAHCFILLPDSKMTCFSSSVFDPQDKDMEPYKLA